MRSTYVGTEAPLDQPFVLSDDAAGSGLVPDQRRLTRLPRQRDAGASGAVPSLQRTPGGHMTGFVQVIEFRTSRIDELRRLVEEMRAGTGTGSAIRGMVAKDRDRPGWYL